MKTREEAAAFARQQLLDVAPTAREKKGAHHYGLQELRDLLDFIYEGPPLTPAQEITKKQVTT